MRIQIVWTSVCKCESKRDAGFPHPHPSPAPSLSLRLIFIHSQIINGSKGFMPSLSKCPNPCSSRSLGQDFNSWLWPMVWCHWTHSLLPVLWTQSKGISLCKGYLQNMLWWWPENNPQLENTEKSLLVYHKSLKYYYKAEIQWLLC